jgi:hypothetical protein
MNLERERDREIERQRDGETDTQIGRRIGSSNTEDMKEKIQH